MPPITTYTLIDRDLEDYATRIKNIFVAFLHAEKIITKEVRDDLLYNYAIITRKPNFFSRFFKKSDDEKQWVLVKQCNLPEIKDDDKATK